MGVEEQSTAGLSIEPIWLETTLSTRLLTLPAPAPKRSRVLPLMVVLLAVAAAGAFPALTPSVTQTEDVAARGWTAYAAGDYRTASRALAQAREADADPAGLATLERAIAVGPILDEVASLIAAGQLARAEIFLAQAFAQSPGDRRTVATQRALQDAQAKAARETAGGAVVAARRTGDTEATAAPRLAAAPASRLAVNAQPANAQPVNAQPVNAQPRTVGKVAAARPTKSTRARSRVAKGSVRILSGQPALVLVDGRLLPNEAPTTLRLPVGEHAIELRVPGTGRVLARRAVRVRAQRSAVLRLQAATAAPQSSASNMRSVDGRAALARTAAQ